MKKSILCYGDSNTWGYIPDVGRRFPEDIRWTGILQNLLGSTYEVIENGLVGRTTVFDDPYGPCRNGLASLDCALLSSAPLDLVSLALGTNDLKFTDAFGSRRGAGRLLHEILSANQFPGCATEIRGIHMNPDSHQELGHAVYEQVKLIL